MTATLTRRLAALEAAPPAPPDHPDCHTWPGDGPAPEWWQAAPVPVRRYVFAIAPDFGDHPGADDLLRLLWAAAERGETVPLPRCQRAILWGVWCEVFARTGDYGRFWGADRDVLFEACQDASGAALVRLWRALGTRQLGWEALALLDANG